MFIRIIMILGLLLPVTKDHATKPVTSSIEPIVKDYSYLLQRDSFEYYPVEEVMAAIAYHECLNLAPLERWLVMEAFYNRVIHNFNNNGASVKEQLLAPKQFTGLWKHCPQWFKYDSTNEIIFSNREMALQIISGARVSDRRIFYWAGKCDRHGKHGRWVKKNKLNYGTINWFR